MREGLGVGGEQTRARRIEGPEPPGQSLRHSGHALGIHVEVRVAHGMDVALRAIGGATRLDQIDLCSPLEVPRLSGENSRIGRPLQRRGKPADFELCPDGEDEVRVPKRHHHGGLGQEVVGIAVRWRERRDTNGVSAHHAGEELHARRGRDDSHGRFRMGSGEQ